MTDTNDRPAAVKAAQHWPQRVEPLAIWVIYFEPKDRPGVSYLARKWEIHRGASDPVATNETIIAPLRDLRTRFFSHGLTCLKRDEADDPVIVESWL